MLIFNDAGMYLHTRRAPARPRALGPIVNNVYLLQLVRSLYPPHGRLNKCFISYSTMLAHSHKPIRVRFWVSFYADGFAWPALHRAMRECERERHRDGERDREREKREREIEQKTHAHRVLFPLFSVVRRLWQWTRTIVCLLFVADGKIHSLSSYICSFRPQYKYVMNGDMHTSGRATRSGWPSRPGSRHPHTRIMKYGGWCYS